MSFFDYFEPVPKRRCRECFASLSDWQGNEEEGVFFLWRQGVAAPIDQVMASEDKCSLENRERSRLPECFTFSTSCETCGKWHNIEGLCIDGIWRYSLIRDPKTPYPSGEGIGLFAINFLIQELAERLGKDIFVYEEDGLGTYQTLELDLPFGPIIVVKQSDHLVSKELFGDKAQSGPSIYVDAYDAIKYGYEKLYWGAIHELNISEKKVVMRIPDIKAWIDEARELLRWGQTDV